MLVNHRSLPFIRPFWSQQRAACCQEKANSCCRVLPTAHGWCGHLVAHTWPGGPEGAPFASWSIVVGLDRGQLSKRGRVIHSPPAREEEGIISGLGKEHRDRVTFSPSHAFACGASAVTEASQGVRTRRGQEHAAALRAAWSWHVQLIPGPIAGERNSEGSRPA